jgi:hypothetical protein
MLAFIYAEGPHRHLTVLYIFKAIFTTFLSAIMLCVVIQSVITINDRILYIAIVRTMTVRKNVYIVKNFVITVQQRNSAHYPACHYAKCHK